MSYANFLSAFIFLMEKEGGTNDDPVDRGGLTKYGISQRQYPDLDIASLTQEDALQIYYNDYWQKNSCGSFSRSAAITLFDSSVNCGVPSAAKWLQNTVNLYANGALEVDGILGPKTLQRAIQVPSDKVVLGLISFRLERYADLLQRYPEQKKYIRGWLKRVVDLIHYVL